MNPNVRKQNKDVYVETELLWSANTGITLKAASGIGRAAINMVDMLM